MKVLVTGGAGFIGSAVIRHILRRTDDEVVNLDKLTYAANPQAFEGTNGEQRHAFERVDICDRREVDRVLREHRPDKVMHLAAETHVDRSIDAPAAFVMTNLVGTYTMLDAALQYWKGLPDSSRNGFRFHHVSTDEVFGTLGADGAFSETTPYAPSSPYSASKAGADHLVRAWHHTYGLPVVLSNCSNNYGPYQFPEKLIPLMILNALEGRSLPVYGHGENVRDWLYVDDHAEALWLVLNRGRIGSSYNIGGEAERRNLDVVQAVCDAVDELAPAKGSRRELIQFVEDRPGHDFRYAMDTTKIRNELGWQPRESFETGLRLTVEWYLSRRDWWAPLRHSVYSGNRLGLAERSL